MILTWTRQPGLAESWRLDDESGAIVATVEKHALRPYGSLWHGLLAWRLYPERGIPALFTRRSATAARGAVEQHVRQFAGTWFGTDNVEFILKQEQST